MRKNLKKILAIVICMTLALNAWGISFAEDSDYNNDRAINAKTLFETIGIEGTDVSDMEGIATRGQFLTILMSLMNLTAPQMEDSKFVDVQPGNVLAYATNFAVSVGIVSDGDNFYPDAPVTYTQAAKMAVEALGLGAQAKAMGGYPSGYAKIAADNDLTYGLSGNENLTVADMYTLLFNLCEANAYTIVSYSYSDGMLNYNLKEGQPFLEVYQQIYTVEGIVDAANGSYLYDASTILENGCVSVNETVYTIADGLECPLGMNVTAFVRKGSGYREEIVFVYETDNKVTRITYRDEPSFKDGKLIWFNDSGKEFSVKADAVKSVVYNGRAYEKASAADFSINAGYIDAIDNDGDSVCEVFSIWEPVYLEAGYVNKFDKIIYDANYENNVYMDDEDITFYSKDDIDSYSQNDIVEAFISKDSRYVKINRVTETVSGAVTGIGQNSEIYIDDVAYKTNVYFDKYYRSACTLGNNVSVAVNADGVIVAARNISSSGFRYGFLVAIKDNNGNGLSTDVMIKIFDQEGVFVETVLANRVKINGVPSDKTKAYEDLASYTDNVVRYQTDKDGNVVAVNTEVQSDGQTGNNITGNPHTYEPIIDGYNTLKRFRFAGDESSALIYYKQSGYFVPHFTVSGSSIIFCIDTAAESEEDKYGIAANLGFLDNDERVPSNALAPYNVSDTGMAELLVYKAAGATTGSNLNSSAELAIVAECSEVVNVDGDIVYKAVLYYNDTFTTYYIEQDEKFIEDMNLADGEVPFSMGDVIRYNATSSRYIKDAIIDFDGETRTLINTSGDNTWWHYYYGKVYSVGNASLSILRPDGTFAYVPIGLGNVCMVDDDDIYTAPRDRVSTYKQVGEDACYILVKCRYAAPQHIYIFK